MTTARPHQLDDLVPSMNLWVMDRCANQRLGQALEELHLDLRPFVTNDLTDWLQGSISQCRSITPRADLDIDLGDLLEHYQPKSMVMTDELLSQVSSNWVQRADWGRFLAASELLNLACLDAPLAPVLDSGDFWSRVLEILKPAPTPQPWITDGQHRLSTAGSDLYVSRKRRELILDILRDHFLDGLLDGALALQRVTVALGDLVAKAARHRVTADVLKTSRDVSTVRDRIFKFQLKTGVSPPTGPASSRPTAERSPSLPERHSHEPDHRPPPRGDPRGAHYPRPARRDLPNGLSADASSAGRPDLGGRRHVLPRRGPSGWAFRHPGPRQMGDRLRLDRRVGGQRALPVAYLTRAHVA
jgi:hypothetical protein